MINNQRFLRRWRNSVDKCFPCGITYGSHFLPVEVSTNYCICNSCNSFLKSNNFLYLGKSSEGMSGTIYKVLMKTTEIRSFDKDALYETFGLQD
jgi:hypothetical protein